MVKEFVAINIFLKGITKYINSTFNLCLYIKYICLSVIKGSLRVIYEIQLIKQIKTFKSINKQIFNIVLNVKNKSYIKYKKKERSYNIFTLSNKTDHTHLSNKKTCRIYISIISQLFLYLNLHIFLYLYKKLKIKVFTSLYNIFQTYFLSVN